MGDDNTFRVDYNGIGNIDTYRFRLKFAGDDVGVELSERSRVIQDARFHGRIAHERASVADLSSVSRA